MFQLRMQAGRGQDGGQSLTPRGCGSARLHWPPAFSTSPSANAVRERRVWAGTWGPPTWTPTRRGSPDVPYLPLSGLHGPLSWRKRVRWAVPRPSLVLARRLALRSVRVHRKQLPNDPLRILLVLRPSFSGVHGLWL